MFKVLVSMIQMENTKLMAKAISEVRERSGFRYGSQKEMIQAKASDSVLKVKVRLFASLRELLGNIREEEYEVKDGTTLMDLLLQHIPGRHGNVSRSWKEWIFETERNEIKFDKDGIPVLSYYLILVNGRSYNSISEDERRPGLRYKLKGGDEVAVLPPVGGG